MNNEKVNVLPAKGRHRWERLLRPQFGRLSLIAMDQIRYLVSHKIPTSFQENLRNWYKIHTS